MKKMITFFTGLLTLFINYTGGAQQSSNNSLLWRVSGKQLAKPSYLFGTMHLICPGDYVWTDKMKASLDKSDKVCFEMDLDDPALMMQASAGLTDMSGKKLKDYFTPAQYTLLTAYVKDSMGMNISLFEQMKPVALQTFISTKNATCDNPVSYEDNIMKTALKSHKEILGLEDPKEQLDALASIPTDTVVAELMDAIQNKHGDDSDYQQLISAYKKQDIAALYTLITQSKQLGDDMAVFLDDRNKRWIGRITPKMEQSSVFFAVGAGHLWGPNGVISLLEKEGYKVEAVK